MRGAALGMYPGSSDAGDYTVFLRGRNRYQATREKISSRMPCLTLGPRGKGCRIDMNSLGGHPRDPMGVKQCAGTPYHRSPLHTCQRLISTCSPSFTQSAVCYASMAQAPQVVLREGCRGTEGHHRMMACSTGGRINDRDKLQQLFSGRRHNLMTPQAERGERS